MMLQSRRFLKTRNKGYIAVVAPTYSRNIPNPYTHRQISREKKTIRSRGKRKERASPHIKSKENGHVDRISAPTRGGEDRSLTPSIALFVLMNLSTCQISRKERPSVD